MNAREIIRELEAALNRHDATITADNTGELILEIGSKFVAFGTIISENNFNYLDEDSK